MESQDEQDTSGNVGSARIRRLLISVALILSGCSGLEDHKIVAGNYSSTRFTIHEFKHNGKIHTILEGDRGLVKIDERKSP